MVDQERRAAAELLRYGGEGAGELKARLGTLSPRGRRAVELTALEGLSLRGAARRLGVSRRTVCYELRRAWGKLLRNGGS